MVLSVSKVLLSVQVALLAFEWSFRPLPLPRGRLCIGRTGWWPEFLVVPLEVPLVLMSGLVPPACLATSVFPALGELPSPSALLQRPFAVPQQPVALWLLVAFPLLSSARLTRS